MSNPYRQYQKTAITTASREKILLMLYEGAIRFTRQAKLAMEEKRIADKGKFISKATAIISELMATLDFKVGGELALDLENLYVFMIDKLIEGNIENNPECLENVESLLNTLYVAWKDVVENPRPDGEATPNQSLQQEVEKQAGKKSLEQEGKFSKSEKTGQTVPSDLKNPEHKLKVMT